MTKYEIQSAIDGTTREVNVDELMDFLVSEYLEPAPLDMMEEVMDTINSLYRKLIATGAPCQEEMAWLGIEDIREA